MARHYAEELRQPAGSEASSDRLDAKTSAPMAWLQIRKLGRENPGCSTLPQDPGFVFPALDEQGPSAPFRSADRRAHDLSCTGLRQHA